MIEKAGKFVAKKAAFAVMDFIIPGSGVMARAIDRSMSAANLLGAKATPDRIEDVSNMMGSAGEFAKDAAESIWDLIT